MWDCTEDKGRRRIRARHGSVVIDIVDDGWNGWWRIEKEKEENGLEDERRGRRERREDRKRIRRLDAANTAGVKRETKKGELTKKKDYFFSL